MSANPTDVPAPRLRLNVYTKEGATVVELSGRLTVGVTENFKNEVKKLMPATKQIVLDLADLEYMDSSGLSAFVSLYVSAKATGCEVRAINLTKPIRDLFGLTNLLSLFEP